ncbi:REP-associated tyrosine transposase [Staphylococcus epidermidis]|nr:hypothetical protein CQA80_05090 [Staphylococcus epidermidis]PIH14686.1 hypothetical protein CTI98_07290 [Staphylococcus epidermidis]PIH34458.1 hypothetical protein CTJ09_05960 [Staphylococcus epidermidis]
MRYVYGSEKVLPLSKKTSHHARIYIGQPTKIFNTRRCFLMSSDTNGLAHTKWNCKYHIVFAPKYRRQVIYGKIKRDIGVILRQLCERKGVEIIEAEACKYPVGVVEDQIYYFNEDNIDNVIFEGYSDQDETRFQELFKEMMGNLDEDIKRGTVQQKDSYGLI